MAENNSTQFKPRPKPTLGEVKDSGVRNVVGIAPRPKPGPNSGKMPPKPNMSRPMPPKPPRPSQQPPRKRPMPTPTKPPRPENAASQNQGGANPNQNNNSQNFNNAYAYQAYSNMLNNMQFMNAIGLVNGIYQNAQMNNRANNSYNANSFDKQTLFDEFYEYVSRKTKNENISSFNSNQPSANSNTNEEKAEEISEAVQGANETGKSLDQYLEYMCSEDDFVKFGLEPLKVEEVHNSPISTSMIVSVKPFQMGKILSMGEYTAEAYENLINKNYSVFFNNDAEQETQKVEEVPEIEGINDANLENEDLNQEVSALSEESAEIQDANSDESENISEEVAEELQEDATVLESYENQAETDDQQVEEDSESEKEEEDVFTNLYEYEEIKRKRRETNENLQEMIEDISKVELEKLKKEKRAELQKAEEEYNKELASKEKSKSSKNQAILEAFDEDESEENEPLLEIAPSIDDIENGFETTVTLDENGEEKVEVVVPYNKNERFDNIAYKALHYDEILRKENAEKEEKLKNANLKQDRLNIEINNLKEIVGSLKSELTKQEGEKQELEEKFEITNTRNKEKDLALEENISNIKELSKENDFMKDVVQSLMDEVAELRASLSMTQKALNKKEQENKLIEQQLASNSYEILAPQVQESEIQEQEIEEFESAEETHCDSEQNDCDSEPVEESQNIENAEEISFADYDIENLQTVESDIFDADTYNIDGIIIDEDSLETSGHFVEKIKLASEDIQGVYNEIRNEIMSYKGVKGRCSSACDTFRLNKDIIAKFLLIGKTMKLYLSLDPEDENLPQNIYHQKDESKKKAYKDTPFMVKLQSRLSVRKAKKLITYMFEKLDVVKNPKYEEVDYVETLERQVVKNK